MRCIFFISIILLTACSVTKKIEYTTLVKNVETVEEINHPQLVDSNEEMQKLYAMLNRTRMPGLKLPKVDFTSECLVVIPYEIEKKNRNSIRIENIQLKQKDMIVNVREVKKKNRPKLNQPQELLILKVNGTYESLKINKLP